MTSEVDLTRLLPPYFKKIEDFRELMRTEETELAEWRAAARRIFDNLFVQTADAAAIGGLEARLGIMPEPGDSLEFRRQRAFARFRKSPPYTPRMLERMLTDMLGEGGWEIELRAEEYLIKVTAITSDARLAVEAAAMLRDVIPAHMGFSYERRMPASLSARIYVGASLSASSGHVLRE
ncbi:MAG: YmfQ family protein [Clostridiales bacterium]|nr:YmfQ family protein [Clostridiales bacterium]